MAEGVVHQGHVQGGAELVLVVAASHQSDHAHVHDREEGQVSAVSEGGS